MSRKHEHLNGGKHSFWSNFKFASSGGISPLTPLLSMYLQVIYKLATVKNSKIQHKSLTSFLVVIKNFATWSVFQHSTVVLTEIPSSVILMNLTCRFWDLDSGAYSCCKLINFPSSLGKGPWRLFELKLLQRVRKLRLIADSSNFSCNKKVSVIYSQGNEFC